MRIFIAGASGAIGRHLVPLSVASGHEVVGTTRTRGKAAELTGCQATDPRDALVLRIALTVGRLARARGLW